MSTRFRLVELMADGRFRSGEWLGQQLGVSRAAVWKQIGLMTALGLDVQAVRGKGYRLAAPFTPLRSGKICAALPPAIASQLQSVEVFQEIDSTNDYLKRTLAAERLRPWRVCCAEWQRAGRGRRGRSWVSPYGSNLYLSLGGVLSGAVLGSGGLSLAMAVALLHTLRRCGVEEIGLKWPNDIYFQGRKLAGILVDLSGESAGMFDVIIGVGVNLRIPAGAASSIDQPWADLGQCGVEVDRNHLAALVLEALLSAIDRYVREGLPAFLKDWKRYDLIAGHAVELQHGGAEPVRGISRGIDANGALLIERHGTVSPFHAGEVSVRLSG